MNIIYLDYSQLTRITAFYRTDLFWDAPSMLSKSVCSKSSPKSSTSSDVGESAPSKEKNEDLLIQLLRESTTTYLPPMCKSETLPFHVLVYQPASSPLRVPIELWLLILSKSQFSTSSDTPFISNAIKPKRERQRLASLKDLQTEKTSEFCGAKEIRMYSRL